MSAVVWDEIELEWQGQTYTVRPEFALLQSIESGAGMSLMQIVPRLQNADLPSSTACLIVGRALTYGGARVTAEQVYAETAGLSGGVQQMAASIIAALLPTPKTAGGKTAGGDEGKPQTGESSTA